MKIKTAELESLALDWAVDFALSGKPLEVKQHKSGSGEWMFFFGGCPFPQGPKKFSTDWAHGGPIIERMMRDGLRLHTAEFVTGVSDKNLCVASLNGNVHAGFYFGLTPLIAAMRCYVASKLGEEIEVPDELCQITS